MKQSFLKKAFFSLIALLAFGRVAFAAIMPEEIISLANEDRQAFGVPVLKENAVLDAAAAAKADDMVAGRYFSHTSPTGVTPWNWFRQVKYEYRYAGENLALHFRDAVLEERAWMASKKHCENILNPKYLETGVAVREMDWEGKPTVLAVQLFGTQFTDAEKISDRTKDMSVSCPHLSPFVLGESVPTDVEGGLIGSISRSLENIAVYWKIDVSRLLLLVFLALIQVFSLMVVMRMALVARWLRRW